MKRIFQKLAKNREINIVKTNLNPCPTKISHPRLRGGGWKSTSVEGNARKRKGESEERGGRGRGMKKEREEEEVAREIVHADAARDARHAEMMGGAGRGRAREK